MTEAHQVGESLRITATLTDIDEDPVSCVSVTISIKKPDGTMDVTDAAMTAGVDGTYYYDYVIPSDVSLYREEIKATGSGGRVTIEHGNFLVESAI